MNLPHSCIITTLHCSIVNRWFNIFNLIASLRGFPWEFHVESKRYINVRAKVIKSFLTISVENNTVEGEEIDFVSRKDDQENHGFGMKNIKNVINKYGGEMTFETNNSCISIFVMLNKV